MSTDARLRRSMEGLLQAVEPSPVPLDGIIRQGKRIRLRRTGAAAGAAALILAGIVTGTAALAPHGGAAAVPRSPATASGGGSGGVFASGIAHGHAWRLATADIADPGYACLPAVTIDGTDADPLYLQASHAAVTLGPADPGIAFAYLNAPTSITEVSVNGTILQPVTVTACGAQFRLVGFAYPLAETLRITAILASGGRQTVYSGPAATTVVRPTASQSQVAGRWDNQGATAGLTDDATVASGSLNGQGWSILIQFGTAGDCYALDATSSLGSDEVGYCGPISTPDGPETIMALPLAFPNPGTGATGYAVQVSPATAGLRATLSNGSSFPEMTTFCVLDGRKYAAFVVPNPLRLSRLSWLDAAGQVIASTTALPRHGYVQFQP
jgi:hypothetical protein